MKEARKSQQERLREWEREINSAEEPQPRVSVENECDLEGPPRHMKYITRYRPSPGIVIPEDPLIGCECPGGACDAGSASGCCPGASDATFPYTKFGRLRLEVGMPVFECNKRCACSEGGQEGCYNRVVQKGRKVRTCSSSPIPKYEFDLNQFYFSLYPGEALHLPHRQRLRVGSQDP